MSEKLDARILLHSLDDRMAEASRDLDLWVTTDNEYCEPDWLIESCFLQLLAIIEALDLNSFHQMALAEYKKTASSRQGFHAWGNTPDGDPYSKVIDRIECFKKAIEGFFPAEPIIAVTKDILQILRDALYSITDKSVFAMPPRSEADIHLRIEAILKCVFPDLKHKPTITKSIKNFEPDTGIPSVRTLIEYKFLSRLEDVPLIADQILADTRGYISADWKRFLYVIYETSRFRKESEWNQLLKASGVPDDTSVVVLSGVSVRKTGRSKKKKAGTALPAK